MKAWKIKDEEIRILSTAETVFKRNKRIERQYSPKILRQSLQAVKRLKTIDQTNNPEYFALLGVEGIDVGEALLISATAMERNSYILTADKRCIKALCNSKLSETIERLEYRFICLEQLIIKMVDIDFEKVARRIGSESDCEASIRKAFKRGKQSKREDVLKSLNLEVEFLQRETGNLLVRENFYK